MGQSFNGIKIKRLLFDRNNGRILFFLCQKKEYYAINFELFFFLIEEFGYEEQFCEYCEIFQKV